MGTDVPTPLVSRHTKASGWGTGIIIPHPNAIDTLLPVIGEQTHRLLLLLHLDAEVALRRR